MKYSYLFFCIVCLLCKTADAQTIYPGGVTNCIARWDFTSTGTFSSLADASGNGQTGATYSISGSSGFRSTSFTAGSFNGSSSYATVASSSLLSPSAITIIALVKPTAFYTGLCQSNNIIIKANNYNVTGCWGMNINDNDGDCSANSATEVADFIGPVANAPFSGPSINTNNWYFLATTYDGSELRRYTVPMDLNTYTSNISATSASPVTTPIGTNSNDVRIGQNQNATYPFSFSGDMDEIAVFNKALSTAEIQSVYNYLWGGVNINQPFADTFLCPGAQFTLNYTVHNTATFSPGNTFTAQLSDASGDFSVPTTIGVTSSTISGTISCTMPSTVALGGSGYRIRITGSTPNYVSPDNGKNIVIGHGPTSATLNVTPNDTVLSGVAVTFTPDLPNKGTSIAYVWKKNSTPMPGSTNPTLVATAGTIFADKDTISLFIRVTDVNCVYTDSAESNKIPMTVLPVSVKDINNINHLNVYPNPNNGSFNITGDAVNNKPLQVDVLNAIGEVVYHNTWTPSNGKLNNNIKLENAPAGIYLLRASSESGTSTMRFTVQK